jgi:hypothetical protein
VCGVTSGNACKNVPGGGTCCKGDQLNLFVNLCSVHGPPCRMT